MLLASTLTFLAAILRHISVKSREEGMIEAFRKEGMIKARDSLLSQCMLRTKNIGMAEFSTDRKTHLEGICVRPHRRDFFAKKY